METCLPHHRMFRLKGSSGCKLGNPRRWRRFRYHIQWDLRSRQTHSICRSIFAKSAGNKSIKSTEQSLPKEALEKTYSTFYTSQSGSCQSFIANRWCQEEVCRINKNYTKKYQNFGESLRRY